MFQTISMRQLEDLLNSRECFTLLDVRVREEFARGHLEGAVNIPLAELEAYACLIPRDRPVIVYCACGGQSLLAARQLSRMGYEAVNASGGLYYYRGTHLNNKTI